VRQSKQNYIWLYKHFIALSQEYNLRYGKQHLSYMLLADMLATAPKNIANIPQTPMLVAITNKQWHVPNNPLQSYRNYYVGEKLKTPKDIERYYRVLGLKEGDNGRNQNILHNSSLLGAL
jgi:hypothetical protein